MTTLFTDLLNDTLLILTGILIRDMYLSWKLNKEIDKERYEEVEAEVLKEFDKFDI